MHSLRSSKHTAFKTKPPTPDSIGNTPPTFGTRLSKNSTNSKPNCNVTIKTNQPTNSAIFFSVSSMQPACVTSIPTTRSNVQTANSYAASTLWNNQPVSKAKASKISHSPKWMHFGTKQNKKNKLFDTSVYPYIKTTIFNYMPPPPHTKRRRALHPSSLNHS